MKLDVLTLAVIALSLGIFLTAIDLDVDQTLRAASKQLPLLQNLQVSR